MKPMKCIAIVMKYDEEGWTERCLYNVKSQGIVKDIVMADRFGVGNMSKAFNEAARRVHAYYDILWFITNVELAPGCGGRLLEAMSTDPILAAIHPRFDSRHAHIAYAGKGVQWAPFTEWTAPMVNAAAWENVGELDEDMPYWGMDMDWSHRAKALGWGIAVHGDALMDHVYLYDQEDPGKVTLARKILKSYHDQPTIDAMVAKWGDMWKQDLWPNHYDSLTLNFSRNSKSTEPW